MTVVMEGVRGGESDIGGIWGMTVVMEGVRGGESDIGGIRGVVVEGV